MSSTLTQSLSEFKAMKSIILKTKPDNPNPVYLKKIKTNFL